MASSLQFSSDVITTRAPARQRSQAPSQGWLTAVGRLARLLFEVWTEARAMQAEASRRYPHMLP